jgi:mono/diheme cytochrome c family protein
MRIHYFLPAVLLAAAAAYAQPSDLAKQREIFTKVCGGCHTPESAVTTRRSRDQWQEEIGRMVANGAKGTEEEFAAVLEYLTSQFGRTGRTGFMPQGMLGEAGAKDKHIVDADAAERGRAVWAAECIDCHGTTARGTDKGSNLIRSDMMWSDRYGDRLGAFLKQGHKMQSGKASASLTAAQVTDLDHFIHERMYETLRGSPIFHPGDLLTGNAQDGASYFNGAGKCATCHSPTGDLKGVAAKYDPPTLQGRFLNPRPLGSRGGRGGRGGAASRSPQVTLTVTPPSGPAVTGTPVSVDDFSVAIRDANGDYHSWKRTSGLKVVKNDPYAAHDQLLTEYSDKNMHDILAYLETLK